MADPGVDTHFTWRSVAADLPNPAPTVAAGLLSSAACGLSRVAVDATASRRDPYRRTRYRDIDGWRRSGRSDRQHRGPTRALAFVSCVGRPWRRPCQAGVYIGGSVDDPPPAGGSDPDLSIAAVDT